MSEQEGRNTPRLDEAERVARSLSADSAELHYREFARQLERDLAEAVAALREITDQLERVGDTREHKDGQFIDAARAVVAKHK